MEGATPRVFEQREEFFVLFGQFGVRLALVPQHATERVAFKRFHCRIVEKGWSVGVAVGARRVGLLQVVVGACACPFHDVLVLAPVACYDFGRFLRKGERVYPSFGGRSAHGIVDESHVDAERVGKHAAEVETDGREVACRLGGAACPRSSLLEESTVDGVDHGGAPHLFVDGPRTGHVEQMNARQRVGHGEVFLGGGNGLERQFHVRLAGA